MSDDPAAVIAATEKWFVRHGLPYFVDDERRVVRRGLTPARLAFVGLLAVGVGAGAGILVGWLTSDVTNGLVVGLWSAAISLGLYAATTLRVLPVARWAGARTFRSLGLLFPLITRALPLLLLFVTFLFINAEVWQVSASLDGGVLWIAVLLFAIIAVAFLLVRLPEELDHVDDAMRGSRLVASCKGTPLESVAPSVVDEHSEVIDPADHTEVRGFQKGNLVLVLLIAQSVQVLLLSVSMFFFFVIFGSVVMQRSVVESWIGGEATVLIPGLPGLTLELTQVSVFLAAFSGLYFTVYAVTDELYRGQFFTSITRELERAIGVRAVYHALKTHRGSADVD